MSEQAAGAQQHPSRASDHLLGKMWKTKSARFNAQARLMSRYWLSTVSTAILACYLIGASILQLTIPSAAAGSSGRIITSGILITSVFLLVITLTESARNYQGEAERMHRSALEISELYNRFQALTLVAADRERTTYNDLYSEILKAIEVNHKDIDFLRFKIGAREDFKTSTFQFAVQLIRYVILWIFEYWFYVAIIFAPPLVLLGLMNGAGVRFGKD